MHTIEQATARQAERESSETSPELHLSADELAKQIATPAEHTVEEFESMDTDKDKHVKLEVTLAV